ncbi:hypothetical protein [Cephaloticoccus capnophilus]|uniref:hypothetical protein n=1 Tax=Cephaloticoccus capnophilus TaxID=1548208 RepID=UPI0008389E44|nr:hypothetical protein [Cephaloticoccus capnophilus]
MDLNLQPLATTCFVSGERFEEGSRVVSLLVRNPQMEVARYDLLETQRGELAVEGTLVCSWVQPYKPRQKQENPDRALKMTAENLFLTLADPSNEPEEETLRLIQFLALMLERKRILRPKGTLKDGEDVYRARYEHAKTKQVFDFPQSDFSPEFFLAVQAQLSVLLGGTSKQEVPEAGKTHAESAVKEPVADAETVS